MGHQLRRQFSDPAGSDLNVVELLEVKDCKCDVPKLGQFVQLPVENLHECEWNVQSVGIDRRLDVAVQFGPTVPKDCQLLTVDSDQRRVRRELRGELL